VVTHQLQVEHRTGKVRRSQTDVLPLCQATSLSTTNRSSTKTDERIEIFFEHKVKPRLFCSELEGNSGISKTKVTSLWNFDPNSKLANFSEYFSPWHVDRRKCCQLSSTDDRRQFITLSVHLCLQHYGRDAASRAGSSATAETFFIKDRLRVQCTIRSVTSGVVLKINSGGPVSIRQKG